MFSQASSDGQLTLTVTFKLGTDPNLRSSSCRIASTRRCRASPDVTRSLGVTTVRARPISPWWYTSPRGRPLRHALSAQLSVLNVKDQLAKIRARQRAAVRLGRLRHAHWLNRRSCRALALAARSLRRSGVRCAVSAGVIAGRPMPTISSCSSGQCAGPPRRARPVRPTMIISAMRRGRSRGCATWRAPRSTLAIRPAVAAR